MSPVAKLPSLHPHPVRFSSSRHDGGQAMRGGMRGHRPVAKASSRRSSLKELPF